MTNSDLKHCEKKLPITVVILTKNEEETIERSISSALSDYTEIVVLDSFSTDQTVPRARGADARVVQRVFKGYASQRNFALHEMEKKTEWIFFLDADEEITPELTAELKLNFARDSEHTGMFYLRRKDMFEGRWIKYSSGYPTWFGRLCHAPSVRVEREINEQYHCTRPVTKLNEHLIHQPFVKGLSNWLDRHNRYSTAEAATKAKGEEGNLQHIFSRDPGLRRRGLKQIYMRLPFRPLAGFVYLYVFKAGFLDGRPGLRYALLRAFYELMISIKLDEMQASKVGMCDTNKLKK